MVAYTSRSARRVATWEPEEFSSPKPRLDARSTRTCPGAGNPLSRQCPLVSTRAGSSGAEPGIRTTEPEQLLSETVPAKLTAPALGAVSPDRASAAAPTVSLTRSVNAVGAASVVVSAPVGVGAAATAGVAPAPAKARAQSATTRGFLMGVPSCGVGRPGGSLRPPKVVMRIVSTCKPRRQALVSGR